MEEKRNLQKLIFSDISAAAEKYRTDRKHAREELQERLIEKAPPYVAALFSEHKKALATMARVEKELSETGYALSGYGDERSLGIGYNKHPQELVQFDIETTANEKNISDLKRDFTLRLFAGGEEAKELFRMLGNAIAKIVS